jgi:hypothetical protein
MMATALVYCRFSPRPNAEEYDYDKHGRIAADRVTNFGPGIATDVARIDFGYDEFGRLTDVISRQGTNEYSPVANRVERRYGALHQLLVEAQLHDASEVSDVDDVRYHGRSTIASEPPEEHRRNHVAYYCRIHKLHVSTPVEMAGHAPQIRHPRTCTGPAGARRSLRTSNRRACAATGAMSR